MHKNILLAVSGMTPQIITETLFGIHQKSLAQVPTKIVVITTLTGKQRLLSAFTGVDNHLKQFCQDYGYPDIELEVLVPELDGHPLDDVRTNPQQEVVADFITEQVRRLSKDNKIAIHASLAGGRKTMGFTLGYAMSLFGRPQDCLSHVLVNEPFEDVPDFYYPTPQSEMRSDRFKKGRHDLSQAEVTLGEIPLVLMRDGLSNHLVSTENISYTQVVKHANQANQLDDQTATVTLDRNNKTLLCNEHVVPLTDGQFSFYAWMASETKIYPEDGLEPFSDEMPVQELRKRIRKWLLVCLPCQEQTQYMDTDLMELVDVVAEQGVTVFKGGKTFLEMLGYKIQKSTDGGEYYSEEPKHEKMVSSLQSRWDTLLRETNKAIINTLGHKLGKHYQIVTVAKMQKNTSDKRPVQCKGIKINPDNIQLI